MTKKSDETSAKTGNCKQQIFSVKQQNTFFPQEKPLSEETLGDDIFIPESYKEDLNRRLESIDKAIQDGFKPISVIRTKH